MTPLYFSIALGSAVKAKLTPTFVDKATAEAGADRTVFWDETLPGSV